MATNDSEHPDPEDMFKDTRMSFGDHIGELRTHMLRALKGFAIGMILGFWPLGPEVMRIIVSPVEHQLDRFEARKLNKDVADAKEKLARNRTELPFIRAKIRMPRKPAVGAAPPVLTPMMASIEKMLVDLDAYQLLDKEVREQGNYDELECDITDPLAFAYQSQQTVNKFTRKRLSTMHISEAFMVYFKIAMMAGFVVSSPWVFYHLWMFVAAGLYPNEKKLVNVYLPFSLFLFLSGVLICQFMVMPKAVEAMLWFNEWLGIGADLRLNEWLGFALMMPLVFGLSFQTPLVMMFLNKVGILSVEVYRDYRRIAWMVMAIFAAVITPSVDAFSMLFLWVPMGFLYELGIWLCVWQGQKEELAEWEIEEKGNELVEV